MNGYSDQWHGPVSTCTLKFVIVGGSLAGLATAYALRRAGHDVEVLERAEGPSSMQSEGVMRSPPNSTRVLRDWGLGPYLEDEGVVSSGILFRTGETGETIGHIKFSRRIIKDFGANFCYFHHNTIYDELRLLAGRAGAVLRYGCDVESVDPDESCVRLASGETVSGDVIIGADGKASMVREVVLGEKTPTRPARHACFNLAAPLDAMRLDPELVSIAETPEWSVWGANDYVLQGCPLPARNEYAMILRKAADAVPTGEHWRNAYPVAHPGFDYRGFEPRVRKLIELSKTMTPTEDLVRDPIDTWFHEKATVVLVGEAAHPFPPSAHHNLGACLEDAVTLGELFGRLRARAQLPAVLAAYEDIRQPRCALLAATERTTITFVSLANGPARDTRDAGLRASLAAAKEDWDDAEEVLLQRTWGNFIRPFDYSAREATQEWWNLWGSLLEKGQGRRAAGWEDGEDARAGSPRSPLVRVEMTRYSISHKCCVLDEKPGA